MIPAEKKCPSCSGLFLSDNKKQVACSHKCSAKLVYYRTKEAKKATEAFRRMTEIKKCTVCGTSFIPFKANQLYCSDRCNQKAYRERNKVSINERAKEYRERKIGMGGMIVSGIKCASCPNVFIPKSNRQKYCSIQCKWFARGTAGAGCGGERKVIDLTQSIKYKARSWRSPSLLASNAAKHHRALSPKAPSPKALPPILLKDIINNVIITDRPQGVAAGACWLWAKADRYSPHDFYLFWHGKRADGEVKRECGNVLCCNPWHLDGA